MPVPNGILVSHLSNPPSFYQRMELLTSVLVVRNVAELPKKINEAFEIATSGRPGPVLVDLPKDVQVRTCWS